MRRIRGRFRSIAHENDVRIPRRQIPIEGVVSLRASRRQPGRRAARHLSCRLRRSRRICAPRPIPIDRNCPSGRRGPSSTSASRSAPGVPRRCPRGRRRAVSRPVADAWRSERFLSLAKGREIVKPNTARLQMVLASARDNRRKCAERMNVSSATVESRSFTGAAAIARSIGPRKNRRGETDKSRRSRPQKGS